MVLCAKLYGHHGASTIIGQVKTANMNVPYIPPTQQATHIQTLLDSCTLKSLLHFLVQEQLVGGALGAFPVSGWMLVLPWDGGLLACIGDGRGLGFPRLSVPFASGWGGHDFRVYGTFDRSMVTSLPPKLTSDSLPRLYVPKAGCFLPRRTGSHWVLPTGWDRAGCWPSSPCAGSVPS